MKASSYEWRRGKAAKTEEYTCQGVGIQEADELKDAQGIRDVIMEVVTNDLDGDCYGTEESCEGKVGVHEKALDPQLVRKGRDAIPRIREKCSTCLELEPRWALVEDGGGNVQPRQSGWKE